MTALGVAAPRIYGANVDPVFNDIPMAASTTIWEGSAVGDNGSGLARQLTTTDPFMGFADRTVVNVTASAKTIHVRQKGIIVIDVVGVTSAADKDETVYSADGNVMTLTSTSASAVGKVHRWISGTLCEVYFEALAHRSL